MDRAVRTRMFVYAQKGFVLCLLVSLLFPFPLVTYAQEADPSADSSAPTNSPTGDPSTDSSSDSVGSSDSSISDSDAGQSGGSVVPSADATLTSQNDDTSKASLSPSSDTELQAQSMSSGSVYQTQAGSLFINTDTTHSAAPDVDTQTGALKYSYPLVIPPGRDGATPDLSLDYNSNSVDNANAFGYGWSISIPYITRLNKHGTDSLYSSNDFHSSLDGDLIQVGSTTSYVPRVENGSFRIYTLSNNGWLVTEKNGTLLSFGSTTQARRDDPSNSSHVYTWEMEESRDTNDNYIKYQYYKDAGQIYPQTVTYSGHGFTDGPFTVNFNLETKSDNLVSYETGFIATTTYRVASIDAKISGNMAFSYALSYTTGHNGIRSLLSSVTESGVDEFGATITLPSVNFTYQTYANSDKDWSNAGWNVPVNISANSTGLDDGARFVDINGDGLPDIVRSWGADPYNTPPNPPSQQVFINTGSGWATSTQWILPSALGRFGFEGSFQTSSGSSYHGDTGARFADVNHDGYTDIVWAFHVDWQDPYSSLHYNYTIQDVWINNKIDGWATSTQWILPSDVLFMSGLDDQGARLMDVNGDSLPDIVMENTVAGINKVYLNNGAGWAQASSTWTIPESIAYAINGVQFADVNGDGLVDIVRASGTDYTPSTGPAINKVYLNTGNGWQFSSEWNVPVYFSYFVHGQGTYTTSAHFADVNGDGLADIVRGSYYSSAPDGNDVYINTGKGWSLDANYTVPTPFMFGYAGGSTYSYVQSGVAEMDADGDNMIDFVKSGPNSSSYQHEQEVYLNNGQVPDLLTSIEYPEGGTITAAYKQSELYTNGDGHTNPNLSSNLNTVNTITYDDQVTAPFIHAYAYGGGENYFASSTDTEFAGFATTTMTDERGNTTTTYISQGNGTQSSLGEYADGFEKIGKPYLTEVRDSDGHLYSRTLDKWDSRPIATTSSKYVFNSRELQQQYDGDSDHKDLATDYTYSTTGDPLTKIEWGEVTASTTDGTFADMGSDKRVTTTQYASSTSPYREGFPSQQIVTNQASSTIQQYKYYYDGLSLGSVGAGNRTKEEDWISASTYATSTWAYDSYGLVTQAVNPINATTTYAYDASHLYPATTTNALNQSTTYVYDYSSGKPKQVRDMNGYAHSIAFDGLDRELDETNPDPTSGIATTTLSNTYTDTRGAVAVLSQKYLSAATTTSSYQYFDGFGRKIQQRDQAEDTDAYVVRDWKYGNDGLLDQESLPYFSTGSAKANATSTNDLFIVYGYDPLNRRTSVENSVGATNTAYDQWAQTVTDPLNHSKEFEYDAFGNLASVAEHNATSTYTTSYEWDADSRLTKLTDALGNIRNFAYDGLGRRTSAEDLHASADGAFGTWQYQYDAAGNIAQTTDPKSQVVQYTYDLLGRPLAENYTGSTGVEITYAYDTCANGKGLLCVATSTGAVTSYSYTPNGLVASETEKMDGAPYVTSYAYDLAGNKLQITYPDSSAVRYVYNAAGLPETVEQKEAGGSYAPVISDTDYAPTGLVSYQEGADGLYTRNTYDPAELYRLKRKQIGRIGALGGSEESQMMENMMMGDMEQPMIMGGSDTVSLASRTSVQPATGDISTSAATSTYDASGREVPAKRTSNSKTFLTGQTINGKAVQHMHIFPGPIGEADSGEDAAVETSGSYITKSGGVEIELKKREIADLITFTANGVSLHITPQVAASGASSLQTAPIATSTNARRYKDLLGANADLELSPQEGGLRKDIVLNALPAGVDSAHDYAASFLMTADAGIDIRSGNTLLSEAGTITTSGEIEILSGGKTVAYIWPPEAHDSSEALAPGHSLAISLTFERTKRGILITKHVPGAWLARATYPVLADFIISIYAGAGDGSVYTSPYPSSWSTQHADTSGSGANYTDSVAWANTQVYMSSTGYLGIGRVYLPFDTSGIPDTATINSATLYVYPQGKYDNFNDAYAYINVYQGFQASPASISNSDINDCGDAITNPTKGSSDADITGISTSSYLPFSLNSTALGWISKTGYTQLCMREGHDATNNEPINNAGTWLLSAVGIHTSETSGTSYDPYLDVSYTVASAQSSSTLLETDGAINPTDLTDPRPKFSSVYTDPDTLDTGVSYEIQISTSSSSWVSPFWDSGKQDFAIPVARDARSQAIGYTGSTTLAANTAYYWRMKFWDISGTEGAWSTTTANFTIANPISKLMDNVYGYDADGNIISITDIKDLDNPTVQVFAYDDLNRLISMGTTTAALSYQDTDRVIQPDTGAGKDTYYGTVYVTGGAPNDTIARIGGWSDDYYSYFQFPLDNLPDSSDISSAHLYLYNQNANNYNEAKLLRITSPWTESGVTSASNPSSNDYGMSWQAVPDNDWWDADVTQLVKDWDNGTYDNYGVKVVGRYDNGDLVKAFLTSDSSDAAHRPKLVITGVNDTSGVPDITLGATTTPVYAYTYGALGNMLSATGQGAYAYAGTGYANPHAATSIGATSLSYDQNGNLIAEGGSTYAWDYANRLASSTGASYAYNHLDQRVSKVVDGTTTYYPNSLYTASAATTTKNIYMGDTLVASVEGAGTSTAVLSYLYQDHLGSTRFATDDFGNLTQSLDYAPYGGESTSTSRDTTDRHYIGQEYDEESNLSYMNARYYEGSRGQFLSQDPVFHEIGLTPDGKAAMLNPQLMNSYSYAGNNPITSKDPTGRFIEISAGGTLPIGISGSVGIRFDNTGLNLFASGGAGTGLGGSLFSIGYVPGQEVSHNLESTVNIGGSGSVFVGTDVSVGGKYNPRSLSLENSSTQVMYVAGARAGAEAYVRKEVSVPILGRQSNINLPLSATPGMSTPNYTASNRAPVSSNQTYITSQAAAVSNISQAFNPTNAAQVQSLNNFMSNFGGSSKSTKKN